MEQSTIETIDATIEDVCQKVMKLDITDTEYANNVKALAELISARAEIED